MSSRPGSGLPQTSPRQLVPDLSERIDWVIRRAMNVDPERRHASCHDLITALTGGNIGPGPATAGKPTATGNVRGSPVKILEQDRRASVRYHYNVNTACNVSTSIHDDDDETQDNWEGTVQDISASGMRLLLRRRFEPGTILTIAPDSPDRQFTRQLQISVIWVKSKGSGHWFFGCFQHVSGRRCHFCHQSLCRVGGGVSFLCGISLGPAPSRFRQESCLRLRPVLPLVAEGRGVPEKHAVKAVGVGRLRGHRRRPITTSGEAPCSATELPPAGAPVC